MAGLNDILKNLPIDEIAGKLGVDPDTAKAGIIEGGQTILSGLHKETETEQGAQSLQEALKKHAGEKKVASVDEIDEEDGKNILGHIFGGKQDEVASTLTASDKTTGGIDFGKLLPLLAPIIMNFVANQKSEKEKESGGGFDLGGLLGGILGGGSTQGGSRSGGIDLGSIGDLIGGFFGGKR
ncbi:DUF937 domain-containing protein [Microbacterium sediminis]|uniref:Uncharacterized protein n=1 Tax=Microbacterium sediminis TaxID=904291 RepID=A0A1B9NE08_9MICO|nr:DUF937 domain-containing protein [Microbacterium sediminis]OCG74841.1 hypothetical protein A7J15_04815 [Microbacterium sediminis]QBR75143.1 DUF937 domain-containing protein [Microbacterium sediminis]